LTAKAGEGMGSKLANGFNKFGGILLGAAAAFTGLIFSARKAVDSFNIFETKVAGLSSMTGLVGEGLDWIKEKAINLSTTVTSSGIRITQSAGDIIDAFKKVGSQRAELLGNKEDLAAVTEKTIILSEAMQSDLDVAVKAVTTSMNQFGLEAKDVDRIINTVAAGTQEGAYEGEDLAMALEKAGTSMNIMGVSFEQGVAVIEAVAPKFAEASTAGNSLDKVFQKMKEKGIGYKDGVFDLGRAIEELENRFAKGETAVQIFSVEHAKMANVLVANQDEFLRLTTAVTGTNKAYEQAAINTDTNAAKLAQASNKAEENAMILGEKLAPALTFSTNAFSYLLKMIVIFIEHSSPLKDVYVELGKIIKQFGDSIIGLSESMGSAEKGTLNLNKVMQVLALGVKMALLPLELTLIVFTALIDAIKWTVTQINYFDEALKSVIPNSKIWENVILGIKIAIASLLGPITAAILAFKGLKAIWDGFNTADPLSIIAPTKTGVSKKSNITENKTTNTTENNTNDNSGGSAKPPKDADKIQAELAEKTAQWNLEAIANERKKEEKTVILWFLAEQEKIRISKESDEIRTAATLGLEALNKKKMTDIDEKYWTKIHEELKRQTKIVEDNNNNLEKSREEILANQIADIEAKYQIEIDKAIASAEVSIDTKAEFLQVAADLEKQKTDEVNAFKLEKETEFAEQMFAIREEYGLITDEEYYQNELDKLDKQYNDKLILEEDYQKALKQINQKHANDEMLKMADSIKVKKEVLGAYTNFFAESKDLELAIAGDNEEEKINIMKKYADIEMAIGMSTVIADTAIAIMEIWASKLPVWAKIAESIAVAATGTMQLAKVVQERNRIKGLAEGGEFNVEREQDGRNFNANYNPSKRGFINKPTVLVGEEGGEYVIPAEGLRNPAISNIVGAIENSRRNKTLKFFNYDRVLGSIQKNKVKGLAEGGFVEVQKTSTSQDSSFQNDVLSSKFDALANEMKTWKSTLKAVVSISDIEYKQNLLNNTKSSATL